MSAPILLKYMHPGVSFDTGMRAVLRSTLSDKDTESHVLERTATRVVISKTKTLRDAALLKLANIPGRIQFQEEWTLETDHQPPRMLMTTTVDLNLYKMQIGTMYECVQAADGRVNMFVQCKIGISGLEKNGLLKSIVGGVCQTEFQQERKREGKVIAAELQMDQAVKHDNKAGSRK
jgi:hypothetical protein